MTELEQLASDVGVSPLDIVRDFGEREAAMLAGMYARLDAASTRKPTQFLPLKSRSSGEFGTVAASIPDDLFGHLLTARGKGYDLLGRINARDLREVCEEFPICRTETVSGKVTSGWTPAREGKKRGGVRFDSTVKTNFAK
jgi:hypothetical protein